MSQATADSPKLRKWALRQAEIDERKTFSDAGSGSGSPSKNDLLDHSALKQNTDTIDNPQTDDSELSDLEHDDRRQSEPSNQKYRPSADKRSIKRTDSVSEGLREETQSLSKSTSMKSSSSKSSSYNSTKRGLVRRDSNQETHTNKDSSKSTPLLSSSASLQRTHHQYQTRTDKRLTALQVRQRSKSTDQTGNAETPWLLAYRSKSSKKGRRGAEKLRTTADEPPSPSSSSSDKDKARAEAVRSISPPRDRSRRRKKEKTPVDSPTEELPPGMTVSSLASSGRLTRSRTNSASSASTSGGMRDLSLIRDSEGSPALNSSNDSTDTTSSVKSISGTPLRHASPPITVSALASSPRSGSPARPQAKPANGAVKKRRLRNVTYVRTTQIQAPIRKILASKRYTIDVPSYQRLMGDELVYVITVTSWGGDSLGPSGWNWQVRHKFTAFANLHVILKKLEVIEPKLLPKFPKKGFQEAIFTSNAMLERRRTRLVEYLRALQKTAIGECQTFIDFLRPTMTSAYNAPIDEQAPRKSRPKLVSSPRSHNLADRSVSPALDHTANNSNSNGSNGAPHDVERPSGQAPTPTKSKKHKKDKSASAAAPATSPAPPLPPDDSRVSFSARDESTTSVSMHDLPSSPMRRKSDEEDRLAISRPMDVVRNRDAVREMLAAAGVDPDAVYGGSGSNTATTHSPRSTSTPSSPLKKHPPRPTSPAPSPMRAQSTPAVHAAEPVTPPRTPSPAPVAPPVPKSSPPRHTSVHALQHAATTTKLNDSAQRELLDAREEAAQARRSVMERPNELSLDDFEMIKLIGVGGFGKVFLCRKRSTGEILALKRLKKKLIEQKGQGAHVRTETEVLEFTKALGDECWLTRLFYSFETPDYLCLAMEYVPGGDLRIILDDFGCLEDSHAKAYFCEMVMCVHTLHKLGYIHRDLKPANFLIDGDGHLKLGDFGLSKGAEGTTGASRASMVVSRRMKAYSVVGTPQYMAKETLMGDGYDASVDWWALGCILFEMLIGEPPFGGDTPDEIFEQVRNFGDALAASAADNEMMSPEAQQVVLRLICDTSVRLGDGQVREIQSLPWFVGVPWDRLRELEPPFIPQLESDTDTTYFDGADQRSHADPDASLQIS
eukprot:CAMPEP_0168597472 /NCGR_PEP_ID=MMETSP0420-20121227/10699_1 /TAXON_ID=498008 /ORGANISM="Pessonella sp." /LENGTH=1120 /DNA_ID=CAMNT_0008634359 /DNA_START=13 /DNA_END=3375 /DNA_ORIENTATION=-